MHLPDEKKIGRCCTSGQERHSALAGKSNNVFLSKCFVLFLPENDLSFANAFALLDKRRLMPFLYRNNLCPSCSETTYATLTRKRLMPFLTPETTRALLARKRHMQYAIFCLEHRLFNYVWPIAGEAAPRRFRITLALVRPFGNVPNVIRTILRSFQISYFSNWFSDVFFLLFFQSFCSHVEGTMKFSSWPFAWDPRIMSIVAPLPRVPWCRKEQSTRIYLNFIY